MQSPATLTVLLTLVACRPAATGDTPKNLLIISMDTLRREHVGYFSGDATTPFLDARMREGAVLEDLRGCATWTYSSLLCLFTGQSTVDLGYESVTDDPLAEDMPANMETMPLWFSQAGFRTVSVTGSPFLADDTGAVTGQGFDTVVYEDGDSASDFPGADWTLEHAAEQAAVLMEDPSDPFYLHVHFMDPHSPFKAPDSYRGDLAMLDPIPYDLTSAVDYGQAQRNYALLSTEEKALLLSHMDVF